MTIEQLLQQILAPLGVSGVLAVFLYLAWKRLDIKDDKFAKVIEKKDQDMAKINQELKEKFDENTRVQEQVTNALERNTEVIEKVLDRFNDTMRER